MKKWSFANICACASLFISLVLICLWYSNVKGFTVVTLETFVGVIVALLAIIVTLAIIWQIYNVIAINNKIEQLNQLEDKLNKQEKSLEQLKYKAFNNIYKLVGFEFVKVDGYIRGFLYYIRALEASMRMNDESSGVDGLLEALEATNKKITKVTEDNVDKVLDEIKVVNDKIRSLHNYFFIKGRYEPIYNEFLSKVKKDEK